MRLLYSSPEEIQIILNRMKKDTRAMEKEIYNICWYMRGGVTREEAWHLSYSERQTISSIIKRNVEATEKSGLALL